MLGTDYVVFGQDWFISVLSLCAKICKVVITNRHGSTPFSTVLRKSVRGFIINAFLIYIYIYIYIKLFQVEIQR